MHLLFGNRSRILLLTLTALTIFSGAPGHCEGVTMGTPAVSRWYMNKKAAVSLRFDDNLESHVKTAIPLLNRYGLKGTFMVSPGRRSFEKNRDFWTREAIPMGHELGNHTMHHRGAGTLKEAEYEILEAARILRDLYSDEDRLLVFASGGGKSWGGSRWSEAGQAYWSIARENSMIDLYDGSHPYFGAVTTTRMEEIEETLSDAVVEGKHQAFTFHHIGSRRVKDWAKRVILGKSWNFPTDRFERCLSLLKSMNEEIWVAPLGDILKYENQVEQTEIRNLQEGPGDVSFELGVDTDPALYDHDLTVYLPVQGNNSFKVFQDGRPVTAWREGGLLLFNLRPETSKVQLTYN